jgi:hypothetical protein
MNGQLIKLRALTRLRKFKRWRRDSLRALAQRFDPMTDDFDRAPYVRAALTARIGAAPAWPDVQGEIAVYTTFCGRLGNLTFNRKNKARDHPHYFVSNNLSALKMGEALGWRPIFLDLPIVANPVESAQQAKVAKALPHLFPDLARHRCLVYTDDKQTVPYDALAGVFARLETEQAAMAVRASNHIKDNILWEFTDSLFQPRYRVQAHQMLRFVLAQMEAGKTLETDRLFATGLVLRDQAHPRAVALNEAWYDGILACGIDCQLAFDFLAQGEAAILDLPPAPRKKYLGKPVKDGQAG